MGGFSGRCGHDEGVHRVTLSGRELTDGGPDHLIFWGVDTGGVAAVMLLVGGNTALDGLKTSPSSRPCRSCW